MAKFRKKPVVVEAEQWFPGRQIDGVVMLCDSSPSGSPDGDPYPVIHTLEGLLHVIPGDWIITGIRGEKYPCKHEIFAAIYEPVIDEVSTS